MKYAENASKGFMLPKESVQKGENYSRDKKTRPQLSDASEALVPLETQEHTTYGGSHRAQGAKGKRGRFCHRESLPDTQQPGDTHSHTLVSSTVSLVLFFPHLLTRHFGPLQVEAGGPFCTRLLSDLPEEPDPLRAHDWRPHHTRSPPSCSPLRPSCTILGECSFPGEDLSGPFHRHSCEAGPAGTPVCQRAPAQGEKAPAAHGTGPQMERRDKRQQD